MRSSGFTILIKDGEAFFCQTAHRHLHQRAEGDYEGVITLNIFERFGDDGLANKIWARLFLDQPTPEGDLRLIKFIRPLSITGASPFCEEYFGLEVVGEGPYEGEEGSLTILSQVTLNYNHALSEWINGWIVRPGVIDYYRCERCISLEGEERVECQAPHVRIGNHWNNCVDEEKIG